MIRINNFRKARGDFALLGANGAGKTTTLECIEGIRSYVKGIYGTRKNWGTATVLIPVRKI